MSAPLWLAVCVVCLLAGLTAGVIWANAMTMKILGGGK